MASGARAPSGIGLGLRWEFLEEVVDGPTLPVGFFEVSPENINVCSDADDVLQVPGVSAKESAGRKPAQNARSFV